MSYTNAKNILPESVIELIQTYIQGEYLYIPKKESAKKSWGHNTSTKKDLALRNTNIYKDYKNGLTTSDLSQRYYLSVKSIQRIVLQEKQADDNPT